MGAYHMSSRTTSACKNEAILKHSTPFNATCRPVHATTPLSLSWVQGTSASSPIATSFKYQTTGTTTKNNIEHRGSIVVQNLNFGDWREVSWNPKNRWFCNLSFFCSHEMSLESDMWSSMSIASYHDNMTSWWPVLSRESTITPDYAANRLLNLNILRTFSFLAWISLSVTQFAKIMSSSKIRCLTWKGKGEEKTDRRLGLGVDGLPH